MFSKNWKKKTITMELAEDSVDTSDNQQFPNEGTYIL